MDSEQSHPSRVRGLKLPLAENPRPPHRSHPSRVRGLKHGKNRCEALQWLVAPLAGAWIETWKGKPTFHDHPRRTPRGCVD